MANNRLYLVDVENGEKFLLAKGWADGWQVWDCAAGKSLAEQLHEWLKHRDIEAAVGNPKSYLTIMTENDPEIDVLTSNKLLKPIAASLGVDHQIVDDDHQAVNYSDESTSWQDEHWENWTDEQFLQYVESHSRTEQVTFSKAMTYRLLMLAHRTTAVQK